MTQPADTLADTFPGVVELLTRTLGIEDRADSITRGTRLFGELPELVRKRLVGGPELAEERAVHDEVRVAADRRGEVTVGPARKPRVTEVPRVVAGLLERPEDE